MGKIIHLDKSIEKQLIYKSNVLNQAVFQLSSLEYRLLLLLISQVQHTNSSLTYHFTTQDIIKLFKLGKSNTSYTAIRDAVKQLETQTLELKEDNQVETQNWLINSIYYDEKGYFVLELNPNLKKHCLDLKGHFLRYRLHNVLSLKNIHSIRLYELLIQERFKGNVMTFELKQLRQQLGILDDTHIKANDFKRRVLIKACEAINDNTDIYVKLEDVRKGNKLVKFRFTVSSRKMPKQMPNTDLYSAHVAEVLTKLGVPRSTIPKMVVQYGEPLILQEATNFLTDLKPVKDVSRSFKRRLQKAVSTNVEVATLIEISVHTEESIAESIPDTQSTSSVLNQTQIKKRQVTSEEVLELKNNPLFLDLVDFGMTMVEARKLIQHYETDYILEQLNYVESVALKKDITSPPAYLKKILRTNYEDYLEEKALKEQFARMKEQEHLMPKEDVTVDTPSDATSTEPTKNYHFSEIENKGFELHIRYSVSLSFFLTPKQKEELQEEHRVVLGELFSEGLTMDFIQEHCPLFIELLT